MAGVGTDLDRAERTLRDGGLVAIPTETVYGLAANGLREEAVTRVFEAKERPAFDPLILHVTGPAAFAALAVRVSPAVMALATVFCPGPITFVLAKRATVPDLTTSGLATVAVRVPNHPLTQALLERLPFPLAAPSANRFGYVSPTRADHVVAELGDRVDYVLDGGPCQVGLESTIVDMSSDTVRILRPGGVPIEAIERVLGQSVACAPTDSAPLAPGMLASHYSPHATVVLGDPERLVRRYGSDGVGAITFQRAVRGLASDRSIVLAPSGRLDEAARRLFWGLRQLDRPEIRRIFAELVPDHGLGQAINDRLRRASA